MPLDLLDDNLRCPLCPSRNLPREQKKKVVMGCGDCHAKVMLVGESPGKHEASVGKPFIGKTGQELDGLYLPLANLSRHEGTWITNTVSCHWADASDAPPDWLIKSCSEFRLKREVARIQPEFVVLMGGISNSLLGLDITTVHGSGRKSELLGWEGWTYSTYHPALGMHMPSAMQSLLDDFRYLRDFLRDPVEKKDAMPNPTYYRLRTVEDVDGIMEGEYGNAIGVDTESKKVWKGYKATIRYIPYCLQFCINPGEAFLIMIEDRDAWLRFGYHINKFYPILMQNAPHDMDVLLRSGIEINWDLVEDTMAMSYIDARVARGLKPMSYQLLGVTASNFDDVVRPYGVRAAMQYLEKAAEMEWPVPEPQPTGVFTEVKCKVCKGSSVVGEGRGKKRTYKSCTACDGIGQVTSEKMTRKQGVGAKISRLMMDYRKAPELLDPWKRWDGWEEGVQPLIDRLGPLPLASIDLVPENEIMAYACLDSHSTRRLKDVFLQRHTELRRRFSSIKFK